MCQQPAHRCLLPQVPTSLLLDTVGRDKVKRSTTQQILQLALPQVLSSTTSWNVVSMSKGFNTFAIAWR